MLSQKCLRFHRAVHCISSSHQGKGSYHPASLHFLLRAPEKGCGHVQLPRGLWFKHIAVMQPNSCLKLRGLRHSVLFQGIWKFRHLHTSHIRMPQTQEESVQIKTFEHLFVEGHNHNYHMQEWVHQMWITKWIPESASVKIANIWSHHHPAAVFTCETANLWHPNQYTHNSQQHAIHFYWTRELNSKKLRSFSHTQLEIMNYLIFLFPLSGAPVFLWLNSCIMLHFSLPKPPCSSSCESLSFLYTTFISNEKLHGFLSISDFTFNFSLHSSQNGYFYNSFHVTS